MSRVYSDYHEAVRESEQLAKAGHWVRLRAILNWSNQEQFTVRIVPRPDHQFGCDLQGELYEPDHAALRAERGEG